MSPKSAIQCGEEPGKGRFFSGADHCRGGWNSLFHYSSWGNPTAAYRLSRTFPRSEIYGLSLEDGSKLLDAYSQAILNSDF
jgi:hypothetical protein